MGPSSSGVSLPSVPIRREKGATLAGRRVSVAMGNDKTTATGRKITTLEGGGSAGGGITTVIKERDGCSRPCVVGSSD